jgi:hypothetical protein
MSNLKSVVTLLVAAVCILVASGALAQPNAPATTGGGGGGTEYVLPYMVVILALVLGLMVVARGSNRRDRERPAGYVEKKVMDD